MRALARICLGLVLLLVPAAQATADNAIPGRILFVKDGDLWLLDGSGPQQLATGGTFSQPSWAPDGSSLAYVYRGTNFADIFVTDDQGQNQTRLTNSQSTVLDNNDWNLRPAFSPDGQSIAFVSDHNSALPMLWLMNADGSARRALTTPGVQAESVDALAWSPDGAQLAFTMYSEPGPTQIGLVPMQSGGRQQGRALTTQVGGALDPSWSPDGNWLAYAGHDGLAVEIYAMQPGDSDSVPTRLTSDGLLARSPVWSPDGQHIAYLSNKTGYYEIFEIDVSTDASGTLVASAPQQLTKDLHLDAASGLSWGH
ncbi:MAG: PD40 domain-containing protein [Chloroflexi bacterium]|nr:PD40 domain-containing protein [Chloroflexota bacterium]MBV9599768.1 PD40 domain-containing protein [Chloroflexota bacterium]